MANIKLGEGINWSVKPKDETADEKVADALEAVGEALETLSRKRPERRPAPAQEPDNRASLADSVNAVVGLKGNATVDEVGRAVARASGREVVQDSVVQALRELIEKVDYRLRGVGGAAYGASGPSNISDNPNRQVGHVTVDNFPSLGTVRDELSFYASPAGGRVAFNSTTGLATAAVVSTTNVAVLSNPAGSGQDLHLAKLSISQGGAGTWERLRNPTFTVIGAAQTNVNRGGGANIAVGKLYLASAVTITAVGTSSKHHHGAANTESIDRIDGGIVLRPGEAALWRFTNPSAVTAGTVAIEPIWWEQAAA